MDESHARYVLLYAVVVVSMTISVSVSVSLHSTAGVATELFSASKPMPRTISRGEGVSQTTSPLAAHTLSTATHDELIVSLIQLAAVAVLVPSPPKRKRSLGDEAIALAVDCRQSPKKIVEMSIPSLRTDWATSIAL